MAHCSLCLVLLLVFQTSTANEQIVITDDIGRTIVLDQAAQSVVSLAPHITENLYSSGAGHLITGAVSYSDYPEEAKEIPLVGSYNDINIETILKINPDLVIAWREGNQKQQVEKLMALGLIVYVNNPVYLTDIARDIKNFGAMTGMNEVAKIENQRFLKRLNSLKSAYSNLDKVSVFYQTWHQPLITVNKTQFIGQVLSLCGGKNIFAELESLTPQVGKEDVIKKDPQVIIASGMGTGRPEWLDEWRIWTSLSASINNNLIYIPPDIIQRSTTRILQGAEKICTALHQARIK